MRKLLTYVWYRSWQQIDDKMSTSKARKRLACIRCVLDCVNCFKENKALPASLCFVPSQVEYVVSNDSGAITFPHALHFWSCPSKIRGKLTGLIEIIDKNFSLTAHGEEFSNDEGDWIQVKKVNSERTSESMSEQDDFALKLQGSKLPFFFRQLVWMFFQSFFCTLCTVPSWHLLVQI